jgi:hypothetical protein
VGVHTAILLYTSSIERTDNRGAEFPITLELRNAGALRFRAAEAEFPGLAVAVSDLLITARLRVCERNIV